MVQKSPDGLPLPSKQDGSPPPAQNSLDAFIQIQEAYDVEFEDDISSHSSSSDHVEELGPDSDGGKKEIYAMATREAKDVWTWKFLVVLVILSTAGFMSASAYKFLHKAEEDDFRRGFEQVVETVQTASKVHLNDLKAALTSHSTWITGEAIDKNMTFPYVTLSTFELTGQETLARAKAVEGLVFTPLVQREKLEQWMTYARNEIGWIEESTAVYEASKHDSNGTFAYVTRSFPIIPDSRSNPSVGSGETVTANSSDTMAPFWQASPPPPNAFDVNVDLMTIAEVKALTDAALQTHEPLFGPVIKLADMDIASPFVYHEIADLHGHPTQGGVEEPHAMFVEPVYESLFEEHSPAVGFLHAFVAFDVFLTNVLPEVMTGLMAVLRNSCGQYHTYRIDGRDVFYLGEGDQHEEKYKNDREIVRFYDFSVHPETPYIDGHCFYSFHLYPTTEFENRYRDNSPVVVTAVIASVFMMMALAFLMYDWVVVRRNNRMVRAAAKSNAIVSNMYPAAVRERLIRDESEKSSALRRLKGLVGAGGLRRDDVPIADLFPEVTLMFADIAGFTAWSSTRQPQDVFKLLEALFGAFDEIAKRRRIYKVETVGDCYVAAAGLPEAREDHAIAMARFARDCLLKMRLLVNELEVTLGPDTADLTLRVGLHSGPVTAGVLRGERTRFQLFGDTMNTASRLESCGVKDKIQISQQTADLLIAKGKGGWLTKREEKIVAKGKGELQTYWLAARGPKSGSGRSSSEGSDRDDDSSVRTPTPEPALYNTSQADRLVKWNVEILLGLLRQIEARRSRLWRQNSGISLHDDFGAPEDSHKTMVLDEVKEIIELPEFHRKERARDPDSINFNTKVIRQLDDYVKTISGLYRNNAFHSFEHASHVVMSVVKLMSRIVPPDIGSRTDDAEAVLHDNTFGITSDPLTQFACAFSALIHDVDHAGIPNTMLVVENPELASRYKGRSVAEQNSVDIAWNLLMRPEYADLRYVICRTDDEKTRFRQLVVNSVMATDIVDKELKQLRNGRWEKAFSESASEDEDVRDSVNRKATIVIEHIIQASDVSHTMQHWHIYRRWNECFFQECFAQYRSGRSKVDPAEGWYKGELGFFDFYIIPLAKKLKDCGVFGVSSDEYLGYALNNRQEWEMRGEEVVEEMKRNINKKYREEIYVFDKKE